MRLLKLIFSRVFDAGDFIVGAFHRQNEFRQLDLESVLNQKDHEECHDRRAGIDDQLPGVAVVKDRAANAPHHDHCDRRQKRNRLARPSRSSVCHSREKSGRLFVAAA